MLVRPIQIDDNVALGNLIQKVLMEMGAPKIGTAYSDPYLFNLFETYTAPKSVYYVIESDGEIIGAAGIGPLINEPEYICELQKMYFLQQARGKGLGTKLMHMCLTAAKNFGYTKCYLETLPYMLSAQKLYKKTGFTVLQKPMGNTGHTSCPVWMIKDL